MEYSGTGVPGGDIRLWIPGLGVTDPRIRRVAVAVRNYDETFCLAKHELTGDWVVTIGESSHPIFGFGRELPNPDDVEGILGKFDMKRKGPKIMADLARATELARLDAQYRASETDGEAAEYLEAAFRQQGAHPQKRVFVPRSI